MHPLEIACYEIGRTVGTLLGKILVRWHRPRNDGKTEIYPQYQMTGPGSFTLQPEPVFFEPDDEMDWHGWAQPAIKEVLSEHEWREGLNSNCRCELDSIWTTEDWIDHVAPIIAERTACDPARAITALWNHQLKQNQEH